MRRNRRKTNMAANGQAYVDAELYTICQNLLKKFGEIKAGKKAFVSPELKEAVRILIQGARPENLHSSFKQNIFDFLCFSTTFSDVLAAQSGVSSRNKILVTLLLKLLYFDTTDLPNESKWKRSFSLIYSILQRNLQHSQTSGVLLNNLTFQALDVQSGILRQSILKLPQTLIKLTPWKFEQAGEISKNLCQWLLVYTTQAPSSGGKKSLFQNKSTPTSQATTVMEMDGSPCRDIFTVLNICKNYLKEHILNIYTFSVLKFWLQYAFTQGDINECLASTISKIPIRGGGKDMMVSQSGSPYSSFGTSRFYDDFSSESDSTPSVTSSFASSPAFSQFDELSRDQLERRRTTFDPTSASSSRPTTPAFTPSRKTSQAFDTISITSDIFSNASNLKNVAAKYCLRIIVQSERSPQKDSDRGVITASVIEAIGILDLLCQEESNFTQKVFVEIKKLYNRIEPKPVAARRVLVALVQFFIHHQQEMMIQIDDILEVYFNHIPTRCYTSQTSAFEVYELCLQNAEFFKTKTSVLKKYVPNLFRFVAWWPCNFVEEACELLDIIVDPSTAAEILHLILDLPCLSASLQLENMKVIGDNEKMEAVLGTAVRPYYKAMFAFILRGKSSGAETIDKMSELHTLLAVFGQNPLVRYVSDIVPALLLSYVRAVERWESEEIYKKIFPILIERVFQLFPVNSGGDHTQVLEIFGTEIKCIAESYPEIVDTYSEEITFFLAQFQTMDIAATTPLVVAVLHTIGDSVASISPVILQKFYNTLETLVFEAAQSFVASQKTHILSDREVVQSLISTVTKLAAHAQELIPRAVVCLNKISSNPSNNPSFVHIQTYAQELMNILNKPQVAPAVLCDRNNVAPWHFSGDSSLLIKIQVLSDQVDARS